MAFESGRHDADESATDRARVDYLAGESSLELDPAGSRPAFWRGCLVARATVDDRPARMAALGIANRARVGARH